MKLSVKDLNSIFYSGDYNHTGDKELIVKLSFLLNNNYLLVNKIKIADKSDYLNLAANSEQINRNFDADGGGRTHVALKLLAKKYLSTTGIESKLEHAFCGYYPDIISNDNQIIIECGHTNNVDKIFNYFTQGKIKQLIQVPYPYEDEEFIFAYCFTPKPKLADFLLFEEQEKRLKLKNIINNNK